MGKTFFIYCSGGRLVVLHHGLLSFIQLEANFPRLQRLGLGARLEPYLLYNLLLAVLHLSTKVHLRFL